MRVLVARILAALVSSIAAAIYKHFAIELPEEVQLHLVEVLIFIVFAVYAIVHKIVDKWINPNDVASHTLKES